MKQYFSILIIVFVGFSCKKDNENKLILDVTPKFDTIKPSAFFPVYPGSYWIYDSGDTLRVDDDYKMYIYCPGYYNDINDTIVVPHIISNYTLYGDHYVKGYSFSNGPICPDYHNNAFYQVLSESENSEFYISSYWTGHQITGYTIKVDTSISLNNIKYDVGRLKNIMLKI